MVRRIRGASLGVAPLSPRRFYRTAIRGPLLVAGEARVRAFAEWRLLKYLSERGLRVPKPVAAGYRRAGLSYRCDLITERIAGAQRLSAALELGALAQSTWQAVGTAIAGLHAHGVDHADLNAHNILL
ncbi:MAG TPA: lipopolysaccharide kinase InaA family protein, partial [Steroidobacteraceae bacterium]